MKAKLITADGAWRYFNVDNLGKIPPSITFQLYAESRPIMTGNCFAIDFKGLKATKRVYEFQGKRDGDGAYIYREVIE